VSIFHHARLTGQVIFSVSIDNNYSEQKFAKETFKHLHSEHIKQTSILH